uniref:Uncharacterized protein n=1 Tax=Panagrolaimus sp. ES5 TaxID=591445 RepID=A0AC34GEC6_9BILA
MKLLLFCVVFFAATFAANALCSKKNHTGVFGHLKDKLCGILHHDDKPKEGNKLPQNDGGHKKPPPVVEDEDDEEPKQTQGRNADDDDVDDDECKVPCGIGGNICCAPGQVCIADGCQKGHPLSRSKDLPPSDLDD